MFGCVSNVMFCAGKSQRQYIFFLGGVTNKIICVRFCLKQDILCWVVSQAEGGEAGGSPKFGCELKTPCEISES